MIVAKAVGFTESAARRIGNAVRFVERGSRDQSAIRFRQPGDDAVPAMKLGKTTSSWPKGTTATITLYPSGLISSPVETQVATNVFAAVGSGKWVMIAQEAGGGWYLIAAEC